MNHTETVESPQNSDKKKTIKKNKWIIQCGDLTGPVTTIPITIATINHFNTIKIIEIDDLKIVKYYAMIKLI